MKRNAWWCKKQGLDGSLNGASPATVLARTGWARSVGGAAPYLTLFSRAGTPRETIDAAVANLEIYELPSARGCTHVVPAADFALALKVGQPASEIPITTAKKYCGVTDKELDSLFEAVLTAVTSDGPLTPNQLKDACGGAVRSLGDAGKKRGLSTTMPLALGYLQAQGEIRRVPVNGRLDQQRYAYARWVPNPLKGFSLSLEEAFTELARRYFQWIGPATLQDFQWFSGLGVGGAKAATAPLGLVPLTPGEPFLVLPEDKEPYQAFEIPPHPQYALISSLDGLVLLRRDLSSLIDPANRESLVYAEKGGAQPAGSLADAPFHAIIDRGRLIGFWEYDTEHEEVVWMTFSDPPGDLHEVISRTEALAREQLGDVRSFSLDSPASRAPRIDWLRRHAGGHDDR